MRLPIVVLVFSFLAGSSWAEPIAVGADMPVLTLEDQHGESRTLEASARHVVFTREMKAGRVAKAALKEDGAALLEKSGTVYVSDVSRMPGVIRRLFAMPGLRRRPYPILLDLEGQPTQDIPSEGGKVTVIALDGLKVTGIQFLGEAEEIRAALEP